jgi:prophage regulatory protein
MGAFDARAARDLYKAAPTDPTGLRRTIRRSQLRQIVPLAHSTIYELERRGESSQRFFLTARYGTWPKYWIGYKAGGRPGTTG